MLDEDFCNFLEYQISNALENSKNAAIRGFWCDGILLPDDESRYDRKLVNDNRKILLTAFFGKGGQDNYELTLNFGKKSLSKYARGLPIEECIPGTANDDWIEVDIMSKKLIVHLD
jgi:hypothetical protein